ncbi:uncharacterized protein APUU_60774S [Aspergillus puulaauensis]|uniref:C2H2-type domain-containing protein n=1 Tax=Aspergillus puulaauensis TaxID=1220207 RepID=A0A7R7XU29_9EURO|nr:uncharacterized protein APUU_60774S [Aspergillus puulaauensis]BCS27725.1 hypothetical protein APUU_60774S [Aspergillus puulaauensis]
MCLNDSSPALTKRKHVCPHCKKAFKRSEHCSRHQRSSHTSERPFKCRFCTKSYGRRDLTSRHERINHEAQYIQSKQEGLAQPRQDHPSSITPTAVLPKDSTLPRSSSPQASPASSPTTTTTSSIPDPIEQPTPERHRPLPERHQKHSETGLASVTERGVAHSVGDALDMRDYTYLHAGALSFEGTGYVPEGELLRLPTPIHSATVESALSPLPPRPYSPGPQLPDFSAPKSTIQGGYSPISLETDGGLAAFGAMFDPIWDPNRTKYDAVRGYAADAHIRRQGEGFRAPVASTYVDESPSARPQSRQPDTPPRHFGFSECTRCSLISSILSWAPDCPVDFVLPSTMKLRAYLDSYLRNFHSLFYGSASMAEATPGLVPDHAILAMCAMGALFCNERLTASSIHDIAEGMLNALKQRMAWDGLAPTHRGDLNEHSSVTENDGRSHWLKRANTLLLFYRAFSSDSSIQAPRVTGSSQS